MSTPADSYAASTPNLDALYTAWTIIANVSEGDWSKQTPEWRAAATRWRDEFHRLLPDREPQPSDGPEYHQDHAAWEQRQATHTQLSGTGS